MKENSNPERRRPRLARPHIVGHIQYAPDTRLPQRPVAVIAVDRGRETPAWSFQP